MTAQQAEQIVSGSALVVGGVYLYRRLIEPTVPPSASAKGGSKAASALGFGQVPPVGRFVTGWGFAFLVISLIAQPAPGFGAALAILAATSDLLANGAALASDVNAKVGAQNTPQAAGVLRAEGASGAQVRQLPSIASVTTPLIPGTIPSP